MSNKVIVFGPTGNVGSLAAQTAHKYGAKVYLAMRDTSKTIPGLSTEQEKQGSFERVTADLTNADTIAAAVKQTGAKHAFIYLAVHSQDHMKSTLEALKSSGIDLVVFLSSFTVSSKQDPADFTPSEIVPYLHAQVELNLEQIFGPKGYVALRPGCFATNVFEYWNKGIKAGEIRLYGESAKYDWTTPEDMGGVAGVVLAKGQQDNQKIVYIFGPQFISRGEVFEIIQKQVLTKPVKVTKITAEEDHVDDLISGGMPPPIAKYLAHELALMLKGEKVSEYQQLEEGQENVQKYLNRPGLTFEEWAIQNKAAFP